MKKYDLVTHTFPPIFDKNSKILILGSIPSIKSREANIYFGNPKIDFGKFFLSSWMHHIRNQIKRKSI